MARIPLTVHPIWLAGVPVLGGLFMLTPEPDPAARVAWGLQPLAWALCVILHEVGHALAGRALSVPVRGIAVTPAGGATAFGRDVRPGREELCTSLAGLAVSLALVLVALATAITTSGAVGDGARLLALFNAGVFAANGLPALPLDGGRAARSLFRLYGHDHAQATAFAGRLGAACSYAIGAPIGIVLALRPGGTMTALIVVAALACTGRFLERSGLRHSGADTGWSPTLAGLHMIGRLRILAPGGRPAPEADLAAPIPFVAGRRREPDGAAPSRPKQWAA